MSFLRRCAAIAAATVVPACALSFVGCDDWKPPVPPPVSVIPAYPDPPAISASESAGAESGARASTFASIRDRIVDAWLADDPSLGRSLGLHVYDGRVAPISASAIAARLARVEHDRAELAAIDGRSLSPDEALDHALLLQHAEAAIFWAKDMDTFRHSPMAYEDLFSVNGYLDRDYAPIALRAEKLLAHEEAALAEVPNIEKNLAPVLAKPVAETGSKVFKGYADYLRKDVPEQLKGVGTPAFQEKLAKTNEALAAAAQKLSDKLKELARKGDDSHVLGPKRYLRLLEVQEGLHVTLAEFSKMGEENLAANKRAYEELVKKHVKLTRIKPSEFFAEATRLTDAARQFIVDHKLATIPSDDRPTVKETPPFQRWNAAFLDQAGVFEERPLGGFYYLTLPDPSWPKKEQDTYLAPRGVLLATTVHEVYPGHFLHGLWIKRAPTRAQKIFASYSFVEGWAHYGEQMMVEEGFGAESPESRLGQLSDALLRNCRVVVSLGVHTAGMTMAQAERRFIEDCKQDRATAREQAVRASFDPGYFAYTLGKIQILALREEAKKRLGARFSLQKFHDALLSHGAPPVALIRERVLHDIGAN